MKVRNKVITGGVALLVLTATVFGGYKVINSSSLKTYIK